MECCETTSSLYKNFFTILTALLYVYALKYVWLATVTWQQLLTTMCIDNALLHLYDIILFCQRTLTLFVDIVKGILTKYVAVSQICSKICKQVEKDYTNEFQKFHVHNCLEVEIFTSKSV